MSWSMDNISFRMAGSGSWQNLLQNGFEKQFYGRIYPKGMSLKDIDSHLRPIIENWHKGKIIKIENQQIVPIGPVITDDDLKILDPWLTDIAGTMCAAVEEHLPEYKALAENMSHEGKYSKARFENILTIQICAHTLDSWVFSLLRKEIIGTYSPRDFAGSFFFWGYGFSDGAKRIFGFTTYGISSWLQVHVLRSHGLDREALKTILRKRSSLDLIQQLYLYDQGIQIQKISKSAENLAALDALRAIQLVETDDPPRLAIPIFTEKNLKNASKLYQIVTQNIFHRFIDRMADLKKRVANCSFSQCIWSDVLCMLFHLSYSYAADALVQKCIIPDFPQRAGGEWGVWVH